MAPLSHELKDFFFPLTEPLNKFVEAPLLRPLERGMEILPGKSLPLFTFTRLLLIKPGIGCDLPD